MDPQLLRHQLPLNLAQIRAVIADACRCRGRDAATVRLIAVTKYASLDVVRGLLELGVRDLGESRAQQLCVRAAVGPSSADFDGDPPDGRPIWHMIGHLQRNKVRTLLDHARIVHSLDSQRLADEVQKRAAEAGLTVDGFVEVNVAGETSKSGAAYDSAAPLAEAVAAMPNLRLRGLTTMAPLVPDPQAARPHFAALRELRDVLRRRGVVPASCEHLSMGMTNDYAVAIEEGATIVRIGSALVAGLEATPATR